MYHDAYYIGILLAMAHSCFYQDQDSTSPPEFVDVKVQLITHTEEGPDFVVYTAIVTPKFLERFADPTKAPGNRTRHDNESESGLGISYAHVNFWPICDLKDRLAKVLGCNTGEAGGNGTGSAGEGANRVPKRKRGPEV
ncbi:hypothetical protein NKR19_g8514 [Coniochaeta hoffmannii]|uniref:Uncharacterized protein n=1 Tax=Coniochaeta hoffmannii TaxID=91930 RepID=A0AA38RLU2_9PEZI|nr:hypothetical protein NKR19_g8514 [Coniochaeta hoffmannii]